MHEVRCATDGSFTSGVYRNAKRCQRVHSHLHTTGVKRTFMDIAAQMISVWCQLKKRWNLRKRHWSLWDIEETPETNSAIRSLVCPQERVEYVTVSHFFQHKEFMIMTKITKLANRTRQKPSSKVCCRVQKSVHPTVRTEKRLQCSSLSFINSAPNKMHKLIFPFGYRKAKRSHVFKHNDLYRQHLSPLRFNHF